MSDCLLRPHAWTRPIATDVMPSMACVSVCILGTRVNSGKTAAWSWDGLGRWLVWAQCTMYYMEVQIPTGRGILTGGQACCNIPPNNLLQSFTAGAGQCLCRRERSQDVWWQYGQDLVILSCDTFSFVQFFCGRNKFVYEYNSYWPADKSSLVWGPSFSPLHLHTSVEYMDHSVQSNCALDPTLHSQTQEW